jgi:hypothetical protein
MSIWADFLNISQGLDKRLYSAELINTFGMAGEKQPGHYATNIS